MQKVSVITPVPNLLVFISLPSWSGARFLPDFVDEAHVVGSHPEHIDIGFLKGRFTPTMSTCTLSTDLHLAHKPGRRAKGWHPPSSSTIPALGSAISNRSCSEIPDRGQGLLLFVPCFHTHVLL